MNRTALRQRAQGFISSGEDIELGEAILDLLVTVDGHDENLLAQGNRPRLTDRQREVLVNVLIHKRNHGTAPTIREMQDALGIKSTTGISDHYKALERKGYLVRTPSVARSLRLRAADGTLF